MTDERSEAASSSVPLDPPVGLDALELQMYREYTEKRTTYCEDMPGAHTVWLRVGVQQFCLSGVRESADEADWMRAMLAKALARLVREKEAKRAATNAPRKTEAYHCGDPYCGDCPEPHNAEVSGAGTASAGLPGYTAGTTE